MDSRKPAGTAGRRTRRSLCPHAVTRLGAALLCAATIIGSPFAVAHVNLAIVPLWPFGKEIV
jgi:uncharacterized membrane protein YccF (DUF307 family)